MESKVLPAIFGNKWVDEKNSCPGGANFDKIIVSARVLSMGLETLIENRPWGRKKPPTEIKKGWRIVDNAMWQNKRRNFVFKLFLASNHLKIWWFFLMRGERF